MLSETVETRWCIEHERFCSVFFSEGNVPYHTEVRRENTISGEAYTGFEICVGPFTYASQPEPPTEEQWQDIISKGEQQEVPEWQ